MALSHGDITKIVRLCADQPYTVGQLAERLNLSYSTIYNFLLTKRGQFYLKSEKTDGLRFVRAVPEGHHLIKGMAKLKHYTKKSNSSSYKEIDNNWRKHKIPDSTSHQRKLAIRKIATIKGFGQSVAVKDANGKTVMGENGKPMRKFEFFSDYHKKIYEDCLDLFREYLEKINNLELCFEPLDGFFGETIVKPYATRFNSTPKQITLRENYEAAWKGGELQYEQASFVTLTTDPKRFNSLWDANKTFQANWNRLITYLRRKYKKELPYVCVREFQKNGRVHFHIAIFGVHLPPTKKDHPYNNPITKMWKRYGQGEITDVKSLVLKDGVFQWEHDRPRDCSKDEPPMKYLKKYLIKAQYDETAQFQYWIYNARYYTYSKCLHHTPKRRRRGRYYQYVGTHDKLAGKFYRRKGRTHKSKDEYYFTEDSKGVQHHETALGCGMSPPAPPPQKEPEYYGFLTANRLQNARKKIYK